MMNNHHNQNCSYAEEIAAYIYGETTAHEKIVFEKHLAKCSNCAAEVAEFRNISFSIGAWRDGEFAHLATPTIQIPYEAQKKVEIVSSSWLAGFRQIFSQFSVWTTVGTAMAALLICAGLIFTAVKFSSNAEVVENNRNSVKPIISPTIEVTSKQLKEDVADNAPKSSNDSNVRFSKDRELKTTVKLPNNFVRVSDAPKSKNVRQNGDGVAPNKPNEPNKNNVKPPQNRKSPSLNTFEEDEDDSLRLADLFAEIDTEK